MTTVVFQNVKTHRQLHQPKISSISDRKLVEVSGLLQKLEPGDEIMADKGFTIQDLLIPYGIRLNMPPFLSSNSQMAASDVF